MAGVASVIDGDTIEVHGQPIRLHGIDAPASRQLYFIDGKRWQYGKDAPSPAPRSLIIGTSLHTERDHLIDGRVRLGAEGEVCRLK